MRKFYEKKSILFQSFKYAFHGQFFITFRKKFSFPSYIILVLVMTRMWILASTYAHTHICICGICTLKFNVCVVNCKLCAMNTCWVLLFVEIWIFNKFDCGLESLCCVLYYSTTRWIGFRSISNSDHIPFITEYFHRQKKTFYRKCLTSWWIRSSAKYASTDRRCPRCRESDETTAWKRDVAKSTG